MVHKTQQRNLANFRRKAPPDMSVVNNMPSKPVAQIEKAQADYDVAFAIVREKVQDAEDIYAALLSRRIIKAFI